MFLGIAENKGTVLLPKFSRIQGKRANGFIITIKLQICLCVFYNKTKIKKQTRTI